MDIKIGKSAHVCCECGREFVHEETFTSVLRPEDQELRRSDYCASCCNEDAVPQAYCVWQGKFYDPHVAEEEAQESFSPLRRLFYEASEAQDRPTLAMAFLAAHLLRRQKVFRLIKESQDPDTDEVTALFNDRIGNRLIEVNDPCLAHGELEVGRRLLLERLSEIEGPQLEEGLEDGQNEDEYAQI